MNRNPYPEYKESGVQWLGQVPAHWEVWKLSHGFQNTGSGTTPPSDNDVWYDGSIPWVTTSELRESIIFDTTKKVSEDAITTFSALKLFPEGSLSIAMYGATIGRLGILGVPATTNQACCVLYGERALNARFMFLWFQAFREQVILLASGGGQPNISQDKIRSIRVACPPLSEQSAIAVFLDRETGRIDTLVAKKRRLVELLKEKRTALISRTVTRGLPEAAARDFGLEPHTRFKDSGIEWLGEVPEGWQTPPLYARYSVELGKMLNESRITGNHLVSYLRNVDVQWDSINFDDLPEMDISENEYQRYTLQKGDLLVCEGGEVGRAAIVGEMSSLIGYQKALHRMRTIRSAEVARFMFYTLFWATKTGVFNAGGTSTIAHLTGEQLRKYRFPTPPLSEQTAIAAYLDRETSKIDQLVAKVEAVIARLQEYRTGLITAAVTGKIDVRTTRHARESGHPQVDEDACANRIPACAGMTAGMAAIPAGAASDTKQQAA